MSTKPNGVRLMHATGLAYRAGFLACLICGATACTDVSAPVEPLEPSLQSAALEGDAKPDTIENRYIVVLHRTVPSAAIASAALVRQYGGKRFYVYETALKGFAVANLPAAAIEALRKHPLVMIVEKDTLAQAQGSQTFAIPADTGLYSLDRIDQRYLPLDFQYGYANNGSGVHIYIIDSGVSDGHPEWNGPWRLGNGAAFIKWSWNPDPYNDQTGHGTSVAAAAAGARIGVAKGATVHSVRIDDGDGEAHMSDIIAGVNWVAANRILPSVANLSYTHLDSEALAQAVTGLIQSGVVFTTAAGNSASNACDPTTQVPHVLTVGATGANDARTNYSNFGPCVDLFAPGGTGGGYANGGGLLELTDGHSGYLFKSGTSFAAPLVAGVAALVLNQSPTLSPAQAVAYIVNQSTTDVVNNPGPGSPNRLLYSGVFVPPPPPSYWATIQGPTEVQPYADCQFSVSTNVPNPQYAWEVSGVPQFETGQTIRVAHPGPNFTLSVNITDGASAAAAGYHFVTVSYSAGACHDV